MKTEKKSWPIIAILIVLAVAWGAGMFYRHSAEEMKPNGNITDTKVEQKKLHMEPEFGIQMMNAEGIRIPRTRFQRTVFVPTIPVEYDWYLNDEFWQHISPDDEKAPEVEEKIKVRPVAVNIYKVGYVLNPPSQRLHSGRVLREVPCAWARWDVRDFGDQPPKDWYSQALGVGGL